MASVAQKYLVSQNPMLGD